MKVETFRREFRQLNGVYVAPPSVVLFRRPLELYDLERGETIATFRNLDEALAYELNGKTLQQLVADWDAITFPKEGGRGGDSGLSTFKFDHAKSSGRGTSKPDLPARLNVKLGVNRSPEEALKAFRAAHVNDGFESGVTVDEHGFITQYVHGTATSVGIWGRKGEIVYHNHPGKKGGAFSDSDLLSTSMSAEKGIVASGREGDYIFIKTHKFRPTQFAKAVKSARMQGKDYDDAVDKWLTRNQKKYGYTYRFQKA